MIFFENTEEFLNVFSLENSPYERQTILNDRKVGFSIQRPYPADIRYIPARTKDGKHDTVAIIYVVYNHPMELKTSISPEKVPVTIKIEAYNRYRGKHFEYNFEDEDCPTQESLEQMKKSVKPLSLKEEEFFYNHTYNYFFNKKGEKLSGRQLIDLIFNEHCDTVHFIKGFKIRLKINFKEFIIQFIIQLCTWLIDFFLFILKYIFGRSVDDHRISPYMTGYSKNQIKKVHTPTETFNIFGHKVSKNITILFSFLILIFYSYIYFFPIKNDFLTNLFSNKIYSVFLWFLIFWIIEDVLPMILFYFLNTLIKIRGKLFFI